MYVKKCPSSIWCWDLNPQPLEHESPPMSTRPGFPPTISLCKVQTAIELSAKYVSNKSAKANARSCHR